jgi:hypothetical protein
VFENEVLRRMFLLKGDEMLGGQGKLSNDEVRNSYSSANVSRKIKSRRMIWSACVLCMG